MVSSQYLIHDLYNTNNPTEGALFELKLIGAADDYRLEIEPKIVMPSIV